MENLKIQFPCEYPIKVIGTTSPKFFMTVMQILLKYDPSLSLAKTSERMSREGKYTSITFQFFAQGEQQLKSMFAELKNCSMVRLVL
ncbi:MAG: YbeD family protein [Candidatus Azotimanducaceae bacterium]